MTQGYEPIKLTKNTPEPTKSGIYLVVNNHGRTRTVELDQGGYWRKDNTCYTWDELLDELSRYCKSIQSLAAHDAQIRAEALGLDGDNGIENGRELLNESLAEAVKEYLLYGAHPLNTEEPEPDDWVEDCDLFNITLTNGDVIDCSELADEVLDAQKRYLNGLPVMQSIPTKEVK
ncbi:MAG: hypothetical protein SOI15_05545 [Bifidobacterium crudilactis]|jgi:hypothetical protein